MQFSLNLISIYKNFGSNVNPKSDPNRTEPITKFQIRNRSDPKILKNFNPKPIRSEKFSKTQSETDPIRKYRIGSDSDRILFGSDRLFITFILKLHFTYWVFKWFYMLFLLFCSEIPIKFKKLIVVQWCFSLICGGQSYAKKYFSIHLRFWGFTWITPSLRH